MSDSDPDSDAAHLAAQAADAAAAPRLPTNARRKLRDLLQHLTAVGDFAAGAFRPQSFPVRLNVSTLCEIRWLPSVCQRPRRNPGAS